MFKLDCKAYHTELRELKRDLNALFAVIIGVDSATGRSKHISSPKQCTLRRN